MNGVEVFREVPVPIRDGLEIFLSPRPFPGGKASTSCWTCSA